MKDFFPLFLLAAALGILKVKCVVSDFDSSALNSLAALF